MMYDDIDDLSLRSEQPQSINCRSASNIMSIIDMVWSGLEVFLVLVVMLPVKEISWQIAVICVLPNIIQLSSAIVLFKNTNEDQDTLILYRICLYWLLLQLVTISLYAGFIIWVTVTDVITIFLIIIIILKIAWRFMMMFFVNELYNELAIQVNFRNYSRQEDTENLWSQDCDCDIHSPRYLDEM